MASLNKFRSKNVLKSHNKLHGVTLCTIIVFNIICLRLPHLCTPHIQLSLRSLSRASNFKHRFNQKDQGGFTKPREKVHLLVDGLKKNADIENPFEHGEVIYYTLDGVLIHPVTIKIQASFLPQLQERKEGNHSRISPLGQWWLSKNS